PSAVRRETAGGCSRKVLIRLVLGRGEVSGPQRFLDLVTDLVQGEGELRPGGDGRSGGDRERDGFIGGERDGACHVSRIGPAVQDQQVMAEERAHRGQRFLLGGGHVRCRPVPPVPLTRAAQGGERLGLRQLQQQA